MDSNTLLEENVLSEDKQENNTSTEADISVKPKKNKNNNTVKHIFNQKECKVISYDNKSKTLDVKFDKYGIRIKDVEYFTGDTAVVQYKGEIGNSDFEYKLSR